MHNNRSENAARVQKRREDVSLQTKTKEGTDSKDTMMSIVETCKKLGISSYKFILDRISLKKKFRKFKLFSEKTRLSQCGKRPFQENKSSK